MAQATEAQPRPLDRPSMPGHRDGGRAWRNETNIEGTMIVAIGIVSYIGFVFFICQVLSMVGQTPKLPDAPARLNEDDE